MKKASLFRAAFGLRVLWGVLAVLVVLLAHSYLRDAMESAGVPKDVRWWVGLFIGVGLGVGLRKWMDRGEEEGGGDG